MLRKIIPMLGKPFTYYNCDSSFTNYYIITLESLENSILRPRIVVNALGSSE